MNGWPAAALAAIVACTPSQAAVTPGKPAAPRPSGASAPVLPKAAAPVPSFSVPVAPTVDGPVPVIALRAAEAPAAAALPAAAVLDGAALLKRVRERKIPLNEVGRTLAQAPNFGQAAAGLEGLGLATREELKFGQSPESLHYALSRLWSAAAPAVPSQFELDEKSPVPAVIVRKGVTTYHIHGSAHPMGRNDLAVPGRGAVQRLVKGLHERGVTLYSEQLFGLQFGYDYGQEIMDHQVLKGLPVELRTLSADKDWILTTARVRKVLQAAVTAGSWALPVLAWAFDLGAPAVWTGALAAVAVTSLVATAFRPWYFLYLLSRSLFETPDKAAYLRVFAWDLYAARPSLEAARRRELPMPLGLRKGAPTERRSKAMAEAVSKDAAAWGLPDAHLHVGINHVFEVAWHLLHPGS